MDKRRKEVVFDVGDYVLLHTQNLPLWIPGSWKLKPIWIGPYRVEEVVGPNAYRLGLPEAFKRLHHVFNVSVLKRYRGSIIPPPDPVEVDGLEEYEVSSILAHRRSGRQKRLEFLVAFEGYDSSANEWLPESHLEHATEILTAYKQAHALS